MKMVAFTEFLNPFFSFLLIHVLSSPTDTVLMLVTYHRNFCSHHGHHLCRGKIGDMMAFPLSQLRAQSSPTSPSVCTPARVYDYGENVSNEESVSLSHYRWTELLGSSDWTIRQTSEDNYHILLGHYLQIIWYFYFLTWPNSIPRAVKQLNLF